MKLKNKIFIIALGIINFAVFLSLLITTIPSQIPIMLGINEEIIALSSKWILLILVLLPLGLAISICALSKFSKASFILKILFVLVLYENAIILPYFCLSNAFAIGQISEIPISLSIFLPLALIMLILSLKLKTLPYLSRPAISFKCTRETEFIWKQTHFFARDVYFVLSFILVIISVIFSFFRLALIELAIFVAGIIISTLVVYFYSKSIYKTYKSMKNRQDALNLRKEKKNQTDK